MSLSSCLQHGATLSLNPKIHGNGQIVSQIHWPLFTVKHSHVSTRENAECVLVSLTGPWKGLLPKDTSDIYKTKFKGHFVGLNLACSLGVVSVTYILEGFSFPLAPLLRTPYTLRWSLSSVNFSESGLCRLLERAAGSDPQTSPSEPHNPLMHTR